jgi:hypothetical protein
VAGEPIGMGPAGFGGQDSRGPTLKKVLIPVAEELHPAPHTLSAEGCPNAQDSAQLLTHGEALLWNQNHSGVFTSCVDPFCVQSMEIGGVMRVENAFTLRRVR